MPVAKSVKQLEIEKRCVSMQREGLADSIAETIIRFYGGQDEVLHLGYVTERALQAIEAGIREQSDSEHWIYTRIAVGQRNRSQTIAFDIADSIAEINSVVPIHYWWWLNKWDPMGSAVRLRIQAPFARLCDVKRELSSRLGQRGLEFNFLRYEPELRLFGGLEGIRIAHELFAHDSSFLVAWARQAGEPPMPMIPPGLSLALMIDLAVAGGLDLFEMWDLFDKIADKRAVADDRTSLKCKELAARVIAAKPEAIFALCSAEQQQLISAYRNRLRQCAEQLSRVYFQGKLECGLRESLVPIMLFHWNRVGLPSSIQAALSRSAADEFARLSRKGQG
jgi:thiopeptide-type bacteriocin biosynthesis protein